MAQIGAPSGRALWRYEVPAGSNATLVSVQACVKTNVLQEATLAIYEDGRLAWSADEGLMIECPYHYLRRVVSVLAPGKHTVQRYMDWIHTQ